MRAIPRAVRAPSVERSRLLTAVNATEPGGVCLVCAAPGYGATTLLQQIADATADAVVWTDLSAGEALWPTLGEALAVDAGVGVTTTRKGVLATLGSGPPCGS